MALPALLPADPYQAASHANMVEHLCGPFRSGAVNTPLTVAEDGTIQIPVSAREPVLLIAPAVALDDSVVEITATLDPAGAATPLAPGAHFAPYSEAGSFVPLYSPAVDPELRTAPPFTVKIAITRTDRDGNALPPAPGGIAGQVEARLLQGTLGKVIYAMGAEKARIHRQAREIAAMRVLSDCRLNALDRFGADTGVSRFADRLRFDAGKQEILSEARTDAAGKFVAEPDEEYRRRIHLYYSWNFSSRANLNDTLNGPGAAGDPNRGLLGETGVASRFQLDERNNEFALAVHLVAPGTSAELSNFRAYIGDFLLVWPAATPVNNARHANRYVGTVRRKAMETLRAGLRAQVNFTMDTGYGEPVADALLRVAQMRTALGAAGKLNVTRGFDTAAGSRYELGLGADIVPLAAAELDQMRTLLTGASPPQPAESHLATLLKSAEPKTSAEDPEGAWLFRAAGFRTIHRVNAGTIYLSTLPAFGLHITEGAAGPNLQVPLEARYQAPGDPGANAVLEAALVQGDLTWRGAGHEAWARVSDANARVRWNANTAQPAPVRTLFQAAGLVPVLDLSKIAGALNDIPSELVEAVELGPALTAKVLAADETAIAELRALSEVFRTAGISAILPFVSGPGQVTVLVAVTSLPGVGTNLSERVSSGFRWYAVSLEGGGGRVLARGSRTVFQPAGPGLTAIVVLGYARRGLVDPYEFAVGLEEGALLTLEQYEFLMNLLERTCPMGIQVNTFSIRQQHVDLDGDGKADPLPPSLFRTYRKFQRRRQRGGASVGLGPNT